jgi:hypothetical protein
MSTRPSHRFGDDLQSAEPDLHAPPAGPRHRARMRLPLCGGESAVVPRVALLARTPKGS